MLRAIFTILLFFVVATAFSSPRVPSEYTFADIKLTITDAARREIQSDVDALHQSRTYFDKKLEKVHLYFPIIERVLKEENVPDDFKYLVIQESALIADAVSTSNAVGFWQFKEVSAREVGLRVDRFVDERMHITASTHAAAKYLKKNNFFFDNWLYALLAYNTGPGGAELHVEKKYMGKKRMEINKETHWYVKKFLAHKVAFENELTPQRGQRLTIIEYTDTKGKSLQEIADNLNIDYQQIQEYNKWLRKGNVPSDKTYAAIIPVESTDYVALKTLDKDHREATASTIAPNSKTLFAPTYQPSTNFDFNTNQEFPKIKTNDKNEVKVNGIQGFVASADDKIGGVTAQYGLSIDKFMKFNELSAGEEIIPGMVYYLRAKRSKAKVHYHVVAPGESAWSIAQKYGIKVKKLLTKNRMREEKEIAPGMVLWLRFIRPRTVPVEYRELPPVIDEPVNDAVAEEEIPEEKEFTKQTAVNDLSREPVEDLMAEQEEATSGDGAYFFEEVNESTEFIDENSYVDTKKNTMETLDTAVERDTQEIGQNENKYHTVRPGETLFAISRIYNISIGQLRQWNHLDDLNVLKVGQQILIKSEVNLNESPQNTTVGLPSTTYRVKQNDTLYSIARKHGISIKELMELNDRENFDVEEGELLIIKSME